MTIHIFTISVFFLGKRGDIVHTQQSAQCPLANEGLNTTIKLWKERLEVSKLKGKSGKTFTSNFLEKKTKQRHDEAKLREILKAEGKC